MSFVSAVCCQVEVSVTGRSLVQRNRTVCCVAECDRWDSIKRKPWFNAVCCIMGGGLEYSLTIIITVTCFPLLFYYR